MQLLSSPFLNKCCEYGFSDASLDVDVLLCFFLKKNRATLLAYLDENAQNIETVFFAAIERRYTGLSIAYIINEKEFFSLNFYVNEYVLIPKMDTELIVEKTISLVEKIYSIHKGRNEYERINIMDIFTGSGCIPIAIASSLSYQIKTSFTMVDISEKALDVAKQNIVRLIPAELQNSFILFKHDAMKTFPISRKIIEKYDIITANPPYVPHTTTQQLLSDGRGEPSIALDGGEDGLKFFHMLAINAYSLLLEDGILLCEIGDGQSEKVLEIFKKAGFNECTIYRDLSGKERVIETCKKNNNLQGSN